MKKFVFHFEKIICYSIHLQVISLRYNQLISDEFCALISDHANPFFLKELHLDGCERISDTSLMKLTKTRAAPYPVPKSIFMPN